jgi:hypothetical protein
MRRFALILFVAAASHGQTSPPVSPALPAEKQVALTPPPGPITNDEKALLVRAKEALDSKKADMSAILSNLEFMALHARTEFRELI